MTGSQTFLRGTFDAPDNRWREELANESTRFRRGAQFIQLLEEPLNFIKT
jgi:hypothetical protein